MDIVIDKNETRIVNGTSTLNIVDDYAITSLKSIDLIASDHLSATTVSGIMSYKSGGKLNMKSANVMTINSETYINRNNLIKCNELQLVEHNVDYCNWRWDTYIF